MNIKLKIKLLINYYLLLITLIIFFPIQAKAQTIGLSISPPILEVMIKPGKSITQAYQLTNNSDRDLYLTPKLIPFSPADHQGNISLYDKSQITNRKSFFSLQNTNLSLNQTFKLSAGKSQQLVLKIDVPQNNPERDYYHTLLIEQSNRGEFINQTGGSHRIKIGSNILMTISQSGQPKTDFKISKFSAQPKFADIFDKVKFNLLIENTGQAFFKPEGKIEIYNTLFNKKMGGLHLLPENILTNSARKIRCVQNPTSDFENSKIENLKISECSFSSWLPGKYKAVIAPSSGNPNQHQTYFYLIPYRLLLALIIILLIIWQISQNLRLDNQ